jgi:hypothetical protein
MQAVFEARLMEYPDDLGDDFGADNNVKLLDIKYP